MITTSRSQYIAFQTCPRGRWWGYEALNGTATRGWERRRLNLPLATGGYTHQVVERLMRGEETGATVAAVRAAYLAEVMARGLDAEAEVGEIKVVQEQAALIEAFGWAFARSPLLRLMEEYESVDVEREELTQLSKSVAFASRSDWIARRRSDGRLFVFNWKTTADAGERWYRSYETDLQMMSEVIAVEQRLGERVAGVIVLGFVKGKRMPEKEGDVIVGWRQTSPLIYGYKTDGNPPLEAAAYDWSYTRRKGWHRFPVWEEEFGNGLGPVEWWVNWLPLEVVEAQFAWVPPIQRNEEAIQSIVRQIAAQERKIEAGVAFVESERCSVEALDEAFPQNFRACVWPSRCGFYSICHSPGVGEDIGGSGLYMPRVPNHPNGDGEDE